MKNIFAVALLFFVPLFASDPTPEQLAVMREFHLSVPPVLLDSTGRDKAQVAPQYSALPLPEPGIFSAFEVDREKAELMADPRNRLTVPPRLLDSDGRERIVTPAKRAERKIIAEIVDAEVVELPPVRALGGSTIIDADDKTYNSEIAKYRAVVVDAGAAWCAPCIRMRSVFEEAAAKVNGIKFIRVDVDASPVTARAIGATNLPMFLVYTHGVLAASRHGETNVQDLMLWISNTLSPPVVTVAPTQQVYESVPVFRESARRRIYR